MKRFLIAIAGGFVIPGSILGFALLVDVGLNLEPVATPFYWIVAWPLCIFSFIFPGTNPIYEDEVTRAAWIASSLLDVLIFSVLTYTFLWWKQKKQLRVGSDLDEGRV